MKRGAGKGYVSLFFLVLTLVSCFILETSSCWARELFSGEVSYINEVKVDGQKRIWVKYSSDLLEYDGSRWWSHDVNRCNLSGAPVYDNPHLSIELYIWRGQLWIYGECSELGTPSKSHGYWLKHSEEHQGTFVPDEGFNSQRFKTFNPESLPYLDYFSSHEDEPVRVNLGYLPLNRRRVKLAFDAKDQPYLYDQAFISAVFARDGRVWMGSAERNIVLHARQRRTESLLDTEPVDETTIYPAFGALDPLYEDSIGRIWFVSKEKACPLGYIATQDAAIAQVDGTERKCFNLSWMSQNRDHFGQFILEDLYGNIWLTSDWELYRFDNRNWQVIRFLEYQDGVITSFAADHKGALFVGVSKTIFHDFASLYILDAGSCRLRNVIGLDSPEILENPMNDGGGLGVHEILVDQNNVKWIWAGDEHNELMRYVDGKGLAMKGISEPENYDR